MNLIGIEGRIFLNPKFIVAIEFEEHMNRISGQYVAVVRMTGIKDSFQANFDTIEERAKFLGLFYR